MGNSNASLIMTLVNSIIGVSILAMPFCYKQCGILLASLILIFSNLMTRLSCHYLLKSAIMTRRRTFELLAFHALGPAGKTVVELSIILLMIGTCIAFFVVMGDLSPPIIGSLLDLKSTSALRPAVLIGIAAFVILPLGLLRNVDSLSSICTASFLFYLFLVFKVFTECTNNLLSGSWIDEVQYWRPAGILQCLPIFSMALSCQTQLLEVFDSSTNCTLDRMNSIVKSAVNLCTALYLSVGFFGYVAYYKQSFSGNLLMSFSESYFSEFIKLGFVLSVAVTFPMVIFPCRASLHSLLFKKAHVPHYELVTGGGNHIPEAQFKCITFFIITSSLIVGLLAPNIEIVLGLLGSTIGVIICILCPPILFICISSKATTEKVLAQILCALGLFIMVMGTYANLYLSEAATDVELQNWKPIDPDIIKLPVDPQPKSGAQKLNLPIVDVKNVAVQPAAIDKVAEKPAMSETRAAEIPSGGVGGGVDPPKENKRVEPPVPVAPLNVVKESASPQTADKSKRIEPPVPVAPHSGEKKAPPAVVDRPNGKRVDEPLPVADVPKAADSRGDAAAAAVVAGAPPLALASKDGDKVPAAMAAAADNVRERKTRQKSPTNGEGRLPDDQQQQKAIQSKIRSKNQDKLAVRAPLESKKVVQNAAAGVAVPVVKKSAAAAQPAAAAAPLKDEKTVIVAKDVGGRRQVVADKPPLPLLVVQANANDDEETKAVAAGTAAKRDILQNAAAAAERDKRDLYAMTTNASATAVVENALEAKKPAAAVDQPERSESERRRTAVVASSDDDDHDAPTCEKTENKDGGAGEEAPQKAAKIVEKISSSGERSESKSVPHATAAAAVQPVSAAEKALHVAVGDVDEGRRSVTKVNSAAVSNSNAQPATPPKKENILLAPSKLSDPVVRLPENVRIDDKLQPALLNVMKPMSRELKTVDDKAEANNNDNKKR